MWSDGIIADPATGAKYKYWVKYYEESSESYGIDEGKISKLTIRRYNESRDICNYDRGWDIEPTDEIKAVYDIIIQKYN